MKKWGIIAGVVAALLIGWISYYSSSSVPHGVQVPPAMIPPPVTVWLTHSNAPLRVFPGVGGMLMILPDGSLWRWGQTGIGTSPPAKIPEQIGTNCDWMQAFAANNHIVALATNGTLREGVNDPVSADPGHDWVDASAGDVHSVALKRDGTLWAWGDNSQLQLGNGPGPARTNLIQIGTNHDWTAVSGVGSYTLGLRKDGTLWVWGRVFYFRDQTNGAYFPVPTQVSADTNWVGLEREWALLRRETVELWQPLLSPPNPKSSVTSSGHPSISNWRPNRSAMAFGGMLAQFEVRPDGTLWKAPYALKSDELTPSNQWRQVGKRSDWVSIGGFGSVLGLTADGTVWVWGQDLGQEPIPDPRSKRKLLWARVMTWLGNPPQSVTWSADAPYQKEPRPLMRLITATNTPTASGGVPVDGGRSR